MVSVTHLLVFGALVVGLLVGTWRLKRFSIPDRVIYVLLWVTLLQELVALYMKFKVRNNMPAYHIYSPVELGLICTYFALCTRNRWSQGVIIGLGILGILFSIANSIWLQDIQSPNTYFLLLEASVVLIVAMISVYHIALNEETRPLRMMQFWIGMGLLLYWSLTFSSYGMFGLLPHRSAPLNRAIIIVLQKANLLLYSGFAVLFILYPKVVSSGARR